MFFGTKSGASKITDRMGLPGRSPEAKVLIRLIDWSAKETDKMFQAMRKPVLPKTEGELGAAIAMARNASALAEVARVLHVEPEKARQLLARCRDAAAALASEAGLTEIVATATRDREAAALRDDPR
jgi:predicted S18 family serine protease